MRTIQYRFLCTIQCRKYSKLRADANVLDGRTALALTRPEVPSFSQPGSSVLLPLNQVWILSPVWDTQYMCRYMPAEFSQHVFDSRVCFETVPCRQYA